jgi:hypothetical protein
MIEPVVVSTIWAADGAGMTMPKTAKTRAGRRNIVDGV